MINAYGISMLLTTDWDIPLNFRFFFCVLFRLLVMEWVRILRRLQRFAIHDASNMI